MQLQLSAGTVPRRTFAPQHKRLALAALAVLAAMLLSLLANPAWAVDLVTFGPLLTGPLGGALQAIADLTPSAKAIIGVLAFIVALISLSALRNMGPVIYYIGVMIFGGVGLTVGGALLGAVI